MSQVTWIQFQHGAVLHLRFYVAALSIIFLSWILSVAIQHSLGFKF